jgi:uncharacterized protein YndB with AHSA1/START domain
MTDAGSPSATASVHINASPAEAYALVTDLATLASIAEETVAMRWRKGDAARPGAVFTGANRNGGRRWSTTCNAEHIRLTLQRLKERAEAGTTGENSR